MSHEFTEKYSLKGKTQFINIEGNPLADMIIEIAKNYPKIKVEDTEWFKLNHELTVEVLKAKKERAKYLEQQEKDKQRYADVYGPIYRLQDKFKGTEFKPNIINRPKFRDIVYQCPVCKSTSGSSLEITHNWDCQYKFAKPNPKID